MARTKTVAKAEPANPDVMRKRVLTALDPACTGAAIVGQFGATTFGELDMQTTYELIRKRADEVRKGNLGSAEDMLTGQAIALNALFLDLTKRSGLNILSNLGAAETYMRLALKAQSQCRATLETLAAIKNPPVVYARQANFAAGHQQVNNGALAHADKIENQPNKLLEAEHGERLDPGAAGEAGGSDQALATVGAIHRTARG